MVFDCTFPKRPPVDTIPHVSSAWTRCLENLESSQVSVKRLATISVKGKKVGSVNLNLIQLALGSLERGPIPDQSAQQVQLGGKIVDTIFGGKLPHLLTIELQAVQREVAKRRCASEDPRRRLRILTRDVSFSACRIQ